MISGTFQLDTAAETLTLVAGGETKTIQVQYLSADAKTLRISFNTEFTVERASSQLQSIRDYSNERGATSARGTPSALNASGVYHGRQIVGGVR